MKVDRGKWEGEGKGMKEGENEGIEGGIGKKKGK